MKYFPAVAALLLGFLLTGCTHQPTKNTNSANVDPFEKYNRAMFKVNMGLTDTIFEPVVDVYDKSFPTFIRTGIHNFFGNIQMVPTIGNDLLQANFRWAGRDFMRLVLNTSLGGLGLVDVASSVGLYSRPQSFGLTLGKWGVKETPYLVLPILGPSSVRGTVGLIPDFYMSPINYLPKNRYFWGLKTMEYVQIGSDVLPRIRFIMDNSLDPYVAMRNAYIQNQHYLLEQVITGKESENVGAPVELTSMSAETASQKSSNKDSDPVAVLQSMQGASGESSENSVSPVSV